MATTETKKVNTQDTASENKAAAGSTARQAGIDDLVEIDLVALFYRFLEKAHWIVLTALAGALIAFAIVNYLVTPIYQATAKIYIVGSDTTISLTDLQIGSNLAADYKEVFKNWHVHELVDKRLNLNYSYSKLSKMVSVNNPSGTHVLYVNVQNPDPAEAKLMADTYAQVAREFIATKMDMREPNVFEEARTPTSPVTPKKTQDIILGFIIGVLLAMAMITIRFISDDRIRTTEDIEKVGKLATLGLIPLQDMEKDAVQDNAKKSGEE